MENVLNLADKQAGWRYYDEQFRHLIGSGMAAWGATHLELYMKAHLECQSTNDRAGNTPRAQTALGKQATGSLLSLPQLGAVQGRQPVQVPTQMLQLPGRPPSLPLPPATPRAMSRFLSGRDSGNTSGRQPFSTPPQPRDEDQTKKGVGAHPSKLPTPVRAARLEAWLEGYDGGQKQKLVSGFKRGFDTRVLYLMLGPTT